MKITTSCVQLFLHVQLKIEHGNARYFILAFTMKSDSQQAL